MHFLVTRPQPECRRTAEKLRDLGYCVDEAPLLMFTPNVLPAIDLACVSALAFTSARAIFALQSHSQFIDMTKRAVFVVGDATAQAASDAGFHDVRSADGDVAALGQLILQNSAMFKGGKVLYAAARDRAGDLEGFLARNRVPCETVIAYEMEAIKTLPPQILKRLESDRYDGVLVYSQRTSSVLKNLITVQVGNHNFSNLCAYALSEKAAEPLAGFMQIKVAPMPNETTLLDLILSAC